jgi:5-methylcytosine-specific restriction endonuclease McrA
MDFSKELANGYRAISAIMTSEAWLFEDDTLAHGTYESYFICRDRSNDPCAPCIDAMQRHGREYRSRPGVKERKAEWNRTRRSRARHSVSTKITVEQLVATYGTMCHLCNKAIDLNAPRKTGIDGWENGLHVDHVLPISKGGADTLENVRPAHGKCNIRKHNKTT